MKRGFIVVALFFGIGCAHQQQPVQATKERSDPRFVRSLVHSIQTPANSFPRDRPN
jgi:hypothetical protein